MRNAELDLGFHGLTWIKGPFSHPWPSVSSVVTFCGTRNAECGMQEPRRESGQPKLIKPETGNRSNAEPSNCGMREPKREGGQPKLINSEKAMKGAAKPSNAEWGT